MIYEDNVIIVTRNPFNIVCPTKVYCKLDGTEWEYPGEIIEEEGPYFSRAVYTDFLKKNMKEDKNRSDWWDSPFW